MATFSSPLQLAESAPASEDGSAIDTFAKMLTEQFHGVQSRIIREHFLIINSLLRARPDLGGESQLLGIQPPTASSVPQKRLKAKADEKGEKSVHAKLFENRNKKKQLTWSAEKFASPPDTSQSDIPASSAVASATTFNRREFHVWPDWELPIDYRAMSLKREEDMEHIQRKRSVHEKSLIDHSHMATGTELVVLHRSRCAFSPLSVPLLLWQAFGTLILIYDLGFITLQVFEPPITAFVDTMAIAILWYWTFDIVFAFFTGYFKEDSELVMETWAIAKHYISRWFVIDLLLVSADWLTVGILMFGSSGDTNTLDSLGLARASKFARATRIIRLLRILRLRRLKDLVMFAEDLVGSEHVAILRSLLRNVFAIIVINHALACLWYWIGTFGVDQGDTGAWITRYRLENQPWDTKYLISLHWSITQFTPGASPLQPETDGERVFCIIVLLFALVAFSMFVSSATNQVTRLFSLQSTQNRQLWTLKKYLNQQLVSRDLSLRVLRYVKIALGSRRLKVQAHDVVLLDLLSNPLREELEMQSLMRAMLVHPVFMVFTRRSGHVMRRICRHSIMEIALSKHDMLFGFGETAHAMFFVSHGVLSYMPWKHEGDLLLRQMHWCCEAVLWTPWVHRGDLRADVECSLVGLEAAKFRSITCQHHMDRSFVTEYARAFVKTLNDQASDDAQEITDLQASLVECGDVARVLAWHRFIQRGAESREIGEAEVDELARTIQLSRNSSGVTRNLSSESRLHLHGGCSLPSSSLTHDASVVFPYTSSVQVGDVGGYPTEESQQQFVIL